MKPLSAEAASLKNLLIVGIAAVIIIAAMRSALDFMPKANIPNEKIEFSDFLNIADTQGISKLEIFENGLVIATTANYRRLEVQTLPNSALFNEILQKIYKSGAKVIVHAPKDWHLMPTLIFLSFCAGGLFSALISSIKKRWRFSKNKAPYLRRVK